MSDDDDNICTGETGKKVRNAAKLIGGGIIILIVIVALLLGNNKIQDNKESKSKNSTGSHNNSSKISSHHKRNETMSLSGKNNSTPTQEESLSKVKILKVPPSAPDNHSLEVCTTDACNQAALFLLNSLDASVNPCEDFYGFACGGWERRHQTLPDNVSFIDEWTKLRQDKVAPAMKALFEALRLNTTTTAHSVVLAQLLYKDCVDQATRNSEGWAPMIERLHYLLGFDWPQKNGTDYPGHSLEATIARFAAIDVQPLVSLFPVVDKLNPSRRIMNFLPPQFGLSRYVFANRSKYNDQYEAYRNFLKRVFKLFDDASKVSSSFFAESTLDQRIDAVLDLESRLAQLTLPETEAKADMHDNWSNRMRFEDFKQLTAVNSSKNFKKEVDWADLVGVYSNQLQLGLTFSQKQTGTQWMVVSDVEYFKNMTKLALETELPVLSDYFALQFLFRYRDHGPKELLEAGFELKKVTEGLKAPVSVWKTCLEMVQTELPLPSARLYVDAHVDPKTVALATKVADSILYEFSHSIRSHKVAWLDDKSAERGKEKLKSARFVVGYPPLLKENAQLDRAFGFLPGKNSPGPKINFTPGKYLKMLFNVTAFTKATALSEMWERKLNDSEIFNTFSPMQVNAFAIRDSNVTFIPIAFLQPPFFNPNLPAYLQLAGIGETLGHELVHLFDDQNLKRRPDGRPSRDQWWTDQADEELKRETDCFIKQYSALVDRDSGLKVNGQLTIRENIADNGGIRTAIHAFESLEKKEKKAGRKLPRLPQMEHFTPEQTFFIAHAQTYCEKMRPELVRTMMMTDAHAPNRYRLNIPLANLKQFSHTFKCPKGSALRPEERCRIW